MGTGVQSSREGVALAELGVQELCYCPLCDPPFLSLGFPICAVVWSQKMNQNESEEGDGRDLAPYPCQIGQAWTGQQP